MALPSRAFAKAMLRCVAAVKDIECTATVWKACQQYVLYHAAFKRILAQHLFFRLQRLLAIELNHSGLQDADAAVALNLFSSRIAEQKHSCHEAIKALAAALPQALAALEAYEAVHSVAEEAASAARAAHQQVLEAQVHHLLLHKHKLLCCAACYYCCFVPAVAKVRDWLLFNAA